SLGAMEAIASALAKAFRASAILAATSAPAASSEDCWQPHKHTATTDRAKKNEAILFMGVSASGQRKKASQPVQTVS
ncbi:MAG: hypothetical protein KAI25_08025, partial [Hyphomicrobiaceae bacterium]|nr:hypothetical protein [Hyphomicrobiaceae bacterium]